MVATRVIEWEDSGLRRMNGSTMTNDSAKGSSMIRGILNIGKGIILTGTKR